MYGRMIDTNAMDPFDPDIIDPFHSVGTPNYSGQGAGSSASKMVTSGKTSSGSSQTSSDAQTKGSQQTTTTTSQQVAERPVRRGANTWTN